MKNRQWITGTLASLWLVMGPASPVEARLQLGQSLDLPTGLAQNSTVDRANRLFGEGQELLARGTLRSIEEAINKLRQARQLYQQAEVPVGVAQVLGELGNAYNRVGDRERALQYYEEALVVFEQINNLRGIATVRVNIGNIYHFVGDRDRALQNYQQALEIFGQIGYKVGIAFTRRSLGNSYNAVGQRDRALEEYARARELYQEENERVGIADILTEIGRVRAAAGDRQEALAVLDRALNMARSLRNTQLEAIALHRIGQVWNASGRRKQALRNFERSLLIFTDIGDSPRAAFVLNDIGRVYQAWEEFERSLELYQQAQSLFTEGVERPGVALTLNNIGTAYNALGDTKLALEKHKQALSIFREIGDRPEEGVTYNYLGDVYKKGGDRERALEQYQLALSVFQEVRERPKEAETLKDIGDTYRDLGDLSQALAYYERALPIQEAVGDKLGQAETLGALGAIFQENGNLKSALNYYQQAVAIARETDDSIIQGRLTYGLGLIQEDLGDLQQAEENQERGFSQVEENLPADEPIAWGDIELCEGIAKPEQQLECYQRMRKLFQKLGQPLREAEALNNIGVTQANLGKFDLALESYQEAISILQGISDRRAKELEAAVQYNLARSWQRQGNQQQAIAAYERSLSLHQQLGLQSPIANILLQMATIYEALGQRQEALDLYVRAAAAFQQQGDKQGEANAAVGAGTIYLILNDPRQAEDYFFRAALLFEGDPFGLANITNRIQEVYRKQRQVEAEIAYLRRTEELYRQRIQEEEAEILRILRERAEAKLDEEQEQEQAQIPPEPEPEEGSRDAEEDEIEESARNEESAPEVSQNPVPREEESEQPEQPEQPESEEESEPEAPAPVDLNETRDRVEQARRLVERARASQNEGNVERAIAAYEEAIPIQVQQNDLEGVLDNLGELAPLYDKSGDYQLALETYERARKLAMDLEYEDRAAELETAKGDLQRRQQQQPAARTSYQNVREHWQKVRDRRREAEALARLGDLEREQNNLEAAEGHYEEQLAIEKELDEPNRTETLEKLAEVAEEKGNLNRAAELREEELAIEEEQEDVRAAAETVKELARLRQELGQLQESLDGYRRELELRRAIGDRAGEAEALEKIGEVYEDAGNIEAALESYQQAVESRRQAGDRAGEAATLNHIADIHALRGEWEKALEAYQQALQIQQEIGDRAGEAVTLNDIGDVYYQQALEILEAQSPDSASDGDDLDSEASDRLKTALEYHERSLEIFQEIGDRAGEAIVLNDIGDVYAALAEPQRAISYYERGLAGFEETGVRPGKARSLGRLARIYAEGGRVEEALEAIEGAIELIESFRSNPRRDDLRTSYFASVQDYYQLKIDLLMELHLQNPEAGRDREAFNTSERSRARTLLELLNEANANIERGIDPVLRDRERSLREQLSELGETQYELYQLYKKSEDDSSEGEGSQSDPNEGDRPRVREQLNRVNRQIENLEIELGRVEDEIRLTNPRYASLTLPEPLTVTEVQQQVLDRDTLLLYYALGEKQSYLWVATDSEFASYELPSRKEIETASKSYIDSMTVGRLRIKPNNKQATELSNLILAPVAERLRGKRLLVVADGVLQYVPFSALADPNVANFPNLENFAPLLLGHEIVNLPSASVLPLIRQEAANRPEAPKILAVLADPVFKAEDSRLIATPVEEATSLRNAESITRGTNTKISSWSRLGYTRTEGEAILELVPNAERLQAFDFDAARNLAKDPQLGEYRIIHLGTHGFLNSQYPENSGIVLSLFDENGTSQNGYLLVGESFNLNLNADLVVLSACKTGLGQEVRGEGIVGLTRGLMYAGATRLAVSLWSVNDEQTAKLMEQFYRNMLEKGMPAAAALRSAQIEMYNAGCPNQFAQPGCTPYYWAPFVLQGDWK